MKKKRRNYRKLLRAGTRAQLEKLKHHSKKDSWDNMSISYCKRRIAEELKEAEEAFTMEEIRHELADIANFAHMGILTCDYLIKTMNKKKPCK